MCLVIGSVAVAVAAVVFGTNSLPLSWEEITRMFGYREIDIHGVY